MDSQLSFDEEFPEICEEELVLFCVQLYLFPMSSTQDFPSRNHQLRISMVSLAQEKHGTRVELEQCKPQKVEKK